MILFRSCQSLQAKAKCISVCYQNQHQKYRVCEIQVRAPGNFRSAVPLSGDHRHTAHKSQRHQSCGRLRVPRHRIALSFSTPSLTDAVGDGARESPRPAGVGESGPNTAVAAPELRMLNKLVLLRDSGLRHSLPLGDSKLAARAPRYAPVNGRLGGPLAPQQPRGAVTTAAASGAGNSSKVSHRVGVVPRCSSHPIAR